MTKLRSTTAFGSVISVLPFCSSDQGFMRSSSLAAAIAALASAAFLSNIASRSDTVCGAGGGSVGFPPGAKSNESCAIEAVCPGGQVCDVACQPTHRARLFMGGPFEAVFRDPFECPPGVRHLLIELGQQGFSYRHQVLPLA